jgi:hypothetical protein
MHSHLPDLMKTRDFRSECGGIPMESITLSPNLEAVLAFRNYFRIGPSMICAEM